jgi:hypothetical protein
MSYLNSRQRMEFNWLYKVANTSFMKIAYQLITTTIMDASRFGLYFLVQSANNPLI